MTLIEIQTLLFLTHVFNIKLLKLEEKKIFLVDILRCVHCTYIILCIVKSMPHEYLIDSASISSSRVNIFA